MMATVMIGQLVGWQFFWFLEKETEFLDERTAIIGVAYTLMGVIGFLFQLIFTGRIHRALGVGVGMRVLPGTMADPPDRSGSRHPLRTGGRSSGSWSGRRS